MDLKNEILKGLVDHLGVKMEYASIAFLTIALLIIFFLAWLSNSVVKGFVLRFIRSLTEKTKTKTGKYLLEEKFFHRLAHLAPAFVISALSSLLFAHTRFSKLLRRLFRIFPPVLDRYLGQPVLGIYRPMGH